MKIKSYEADTEGALPSLPIHKLLSYEETARMLGVSRETVYRYQRAGRLPAIRLSSRTVRFRYTDVTVLVAGAVSGLGVVNTTRVAKCEPPFMTTTASLQPTANGRAEE
jgi:excisionase family DNA binding protein